MAKTKKTTKTLTEAQAWLILEESFAERFGLCWEVTKLARVGLLDRLTARAMHDRIGVAVRKRETATGRSMAYLTDPPPYQAEDEVRTALARKARLAATRKEARRG